jgi:hypothetical protein
MLARPIALSVCFGWALARLDAVPLPDDLRKRGPIDSVTVAAYEKLGAEYCGFHLGPSGTEFIPGKEAATKQLPGFRFFLIAQERLFSIITTGGSPVWALFFEDYQRRADKPKETYKPLRV